MTYRRGYNTDLAQPTVPVGRGTAGFKGVAKVAGDPTRVFSPRALVVPAVADTPVTAAGEELDLGGPGGPVAAEDVTVDPPVGGASDVQAALEAGVGPIQVVERTLTSPEILDLNTTAIELVPGEADIVMWPISAFLVYHAGATPYTLAGGDMACFGPPFWAVGFMQVPLDSLLTLGEAVVADQSIGVANEPIPFANAIGAALTMFDHIGDPTDGDGTLDVVVYYRKVTVA